MGEPPKYTTQKIEGFEQLDEVVVGTRRRIVQIERGKLEGRLFHASIGDLPIDFVTFNLGLRTRGLANKDRIAIGMLTGSTGRVTRSSYASHPGDILVTLPGGEHESRYYGGASIFAISLAPADIESMFRAEGRLGDPATWTDNHYRATTYAVQQVIPGIQSLVTDISTSGAGLNADAIEFWKRTIISAMTRSMAEAVPSKRDDRLPSALKVVRRVEEYLDANDNAPVHISQICSQLYVSRRTLHRAFHEALGIGPIAFLRHRRMCSIRAALRSDDFAETIADLALQHGFQHIGRFAIHYRQIFGESPSDTRRRKRAPSYRGAR